MFNSAFAHLSACDGDYYPRSLREDIDAVNALVYPAINNGAYRCAFATTQAAYEKAVNLYRCQKALLPKSSHHQSRWRCACGA